MTKKNAKLPKKIAGVKISKKVRKTGNKLIEAAGTPVGRELPAAGLVAAGTALAKAQRDRRQSEAASEPKIDPAERGAQMAGQIGAALGAAANAALDRVFGPSAGGPASEDGAAPAPKPH